MHLIGYILFYLAGLLLQFSFMKYISFNGIAPNIILILIILVALKRGSFYGEMFGFFWGISWDILSADLFGSHIFVFTVIGYLCGFLSHKWDESKVVPQIVLAFLCSVFLWASIYVLYIIFGSHEFKLKVNYIIVIQPFINALIAPVIFALGNKFIKTEF